MTPLRFFLGQQVLPGLINAAINGGIAWAQHGQSPKVGLWDNGAYAVDLLATGFLLPALSWLILRPLLRRQQSQGKAPCLEGQRAPRLLPWMPSSLWRGSLVIGLLGMTLVGGFCLLLALALGQPGFPGPHYAMVKAAYSGLLTLALQPLMVFAALHRAPTSAKSDNRQSTHRQQPNRP
ncbi:MULTISPECIES: hypothetical protein [Burkholderiales]|jgi:hypothetical protein|uniref:Uncharacterized protein n=1 Tax=Sphaerotilus microaerophilus TaxID=2914710 RepID=A0ABM7YP13_9BURK|nr:MULTISPECIES: hypothetical protein [Burkholderiales]BDI06248.1 hypothetical protein CATMQ487_32180 [Sphaerotilus sp. FB-5]